MSQEQYGINVGSHQIIQDSFPDNQLLVDLLQDFGVERSVIDTIDSKASAGFDVRNMIAGHPYTILRSTESQDVEFFIYEETDENFVVIDLRDGVNISRGNQPVTTEVKSVYLPIVTTLYEATTDKGVDVALVKSLENIFANHVDFRHLDAGDFCKVIFEERYVDGNFIGLGQVLASEFHQGDTKYQAFLHAVNDTLGMYFDQYGENLHLPLLPYPVDSAELTAMEYKSAKGSYRFTTREEGLPVLALSSGKISMIHTTKPDYFHLLLTHSHVTRFQYRYMSDVEERITEGAYVKQGDTLGFTSTLSSGEKGVEVTFWHLGEKINGLPESNSHPLIAYPNDQANFLKMRKKMIRLLGNIHQNLI